MENIMWDRVWTYHEERGPQSVYIEPLEYHKGEPLDEQIL